MARKNGRTKFALKKGVPSRGFTEIHVPTIAEQHLYA